MKQPRGALARDQLDKGWPYPGVAVAVWYFAGRLSAVRRVFGGPCGPVHSTNRSRRLAA